MKEHKWLIIDKPDSQTVENLAKSINVNETLAQLLVQRGIDSYEKAKSFFRPNLDELHDPFLMKDMDRAAQRLAEAIDNEENVLIYGDYDVDGTTSVSLMFSFLKHWLPPGNLDYYIPDRYKEGYGISKAGIDYAKEKQVNLMVALDCGIRALELTDYANSQGVDVIICDHHNPGEVLPKAVAVLDPKRKDCEYPYKELSGCGVGFKFLQALCLHQGYDETMLYEFLDFVAVSVAADIVPITGENRIFTYHGLRLLNENPRVGFAALKHVSGFDHEMSITNVVFGIAPRINAAGRIYHAKDAVDLLITEDEKEAATFADIVNTTNQERKEFDQAVKLEALEMIESDQKLVEAKSTVLFKKDWHKGVVGIAASRCIEHYYRPTIILTESNGKVVGSARSVKGFDVHEALIKCEEYIEQFGGHKYAAGMTIDLGQLANFKRKFEQVVADSITEELLTPVLKIDLQVTLDELDLKFYKVLKQVAPFGPGNMRPTLVVKGVRDAGNSRIVGETKEHLKISVRQGSSKIMDGIAFGHADKLDLFKSGKMLDIAFTLDLNEWNGNVNLQMMVKGIRENR